MEARRIEYGNPERLTCAKGGFWIEIQSEEGRDIINVGGYTQDIAWSSYDVAKDWNKPRYKISVPNFIDFLLRGQKEIEDYSAKVKEKEERIKDLNNEIQRLKEEIKKKEEEMMRYEKRIEKHKRKIKRLTKLIVNLL